MVVAIERRRLTLPAAQNSAMTNQYLSSIIAMRGWVMRTHCAFGGFSARSSLLTRGRSAMATRLPPPPRPEIHRDASRCNCVENTREQTVNKDKQRAVRSS